MPGLIANRLPSTTLRPFNPDKQLSEAESVGYDPTLGAVNTETDTVAGQLDKILSQDNPYVTRARASSTQAMNARGLVNTTMAGQAGEAAAIDAALPIASQDAATFSTQRLTNQQAGNTASQFGAGAANQAGIVNAGAANQIVQQKLTGEQQIGAIGAQGEQTRATQAQGGDISARIATLQGQIQTGLLDTQGVQTRMTDAQRAAAQTELATLQGTIQSSLSTQQAGEATALQELKGTQATGLADIEAEFKGLMQANASAATLLSQTSKRIGDILNDPNTSVEQKQRAVDIEVDLLRNELTIIGAIVGVDLAGLIDFAPVVPGAPPPPPSDDDDDDFPVDGGE
jgi:hypothetical protein